LRAAVVEPIAVVISPSKIKVELKMTKAAEGQWGTLGRLAMQEATSQEGAEVAAGGAHTASTFSPSTSRSVTAPMTPRPQRRRRQ
jgi:hypothetical protein